MDIEQVEYEGDLPDAFEEALLGKLSARQRQRGENVFPLLSRRQIEQAFIETFELVGGVPRLALWANEPRNFGKFLELLVKFAPKEAVAASQGSVIEYRSNVPSSPLNRPSSLQQEAEDAPSE